MRYRALQRDRGGDALIRTGNSNLCELHGAAIDNRCCRCTSRNSRRDKVITIGGPFRSLALAVVARLQSFIGRIARRLDNPLQLVRVILRSQIHGQVAGDIANGDNAPSILHLGAFIGAACSRCSVNPISTNGVACDDLVCQLVVENMSVRNHIRVLFHILRLKHRLTLLEGDLMVIGLQGQGYCASGMGWDRNGGRFPCESSIGIGRTIGHHKLVARSQDCVAAIDRNAGQSRHIVSQERHGLVCATTVHDELIGRILRAILRNAPSDAAVILGRGQCDLGIAGQAGDRDSRTGIGISVAARIDSGDDRIRGGGVGGCIACHILLGQLVAALIHEGHDVVIGHGVHCDHAVFGDGRLLVGICVVIGLGPNGNGGVPSSLRICSRNHQRIDILRCCSIGDRRLRHRIQLTAFSHFVQRNGSVKRIGVGHIGVL